jgi:hypothetical protein
LNEQIKRRTNFGVVIPMQAPTNTYSAFQFIHLLFDYLKMIDNKDTAPLKITLYSLQINNLKDQEPILRLLNSQLRRKRCSRLQRFFRVEENNFVFKAH